MNREIVHVGKPWEKKVFFSLGVIATGRVLFTAGITARDPDGDVVGVGDIAAQTAQCFSNLGDILRTAGARWTDVIKYTIFTTDVVNFDRNTHALRSPYFAGHPAATLVEVRRLIHEDMLVEIEAIVSLPEKQLA